MQIPAPGRIVAVSLAVLLAAFQPALARDPVTAILTVDGRSFTRTFSDTTDAVDVLRESTLRRLVPGYSSRSSLSVVVDVRGLVVNVSSAPNSGAILLTSEAAGYSRSFDAGSRDASREQIERFLRGREDKEGLRQLVRTLVANSTADPVAGNPSSLLGQSVIADFAAGTLPPGDDGRLGPRAAGWHAAIGAGLQRQSGGDFDIRTYNLPIAVSYAFGQDGPEAFLQVPLAMTDTSGNASYMGSGALGLRLPLVTEPALRWALTPALRWGAVGSRDIGTLGQVYGGSLTSDLRIGLGAFTLGIGNGVSRLRTAPLKAGRDSVAYELDNWAFRNGVSLSLPVAEIAGRGLDVGLSFTDTRMTGNALAVGNWQEYGAFAALGGGLRASASYLNGERGFNGFRIAISAGF